MVADNYFFQSGFVYGQDAILQPAYFRGVHVNTNHFGTHFRQACPVTNPTYPVPTTTTFMSFHFY